MTMLNPFGDDWVVDTALFFTYLTFCIIGFLILYGLSAILLGKIFKKAKVPSWKAWVPLYNLWKLFQIGGYAGGWSLFPLIVVFSSASYGLLSQSCTSCETLPADKVVALCLLTVIALIAAIVFVAKYLLAMWNITKKLGKNFIYMILLFVNLGPSLWLWILALDKSKWNDKLGRASLAPEMRKKVSKNK